MLKARFGGVAHRIAAGLVGDGSECHGFDDEVSRDHDWGPGFCLWLARDDFEDFGAELSEAYEALPKSFGGFGPRRTSRWGEGRVGVFCIEDFYAGFIGLPRAPETLDEWLAIPENCLAAATNGAVFYDPSGGFSKIRNALLKFYPEDVRRKKIASRLMTASQAGQYNFGRSAARGDLFAASYSKIKFASDSISMIYLLNLRYTPFYKWMYKGLGELATLGSKTQSLVTALLAEPDFKKNEEVIEEACSVFAEELRRQGLSDASGSWLAGHGPRVVMGITDPGLRARNIWVG